MITEMELNKAIEEASISGGSKDVDIAELFTVYDDRIIIEDFTTKKIGSDLVKCELFIKANKDLSSSMSSILSTTNSVTNFKYITGDSLTWNSSTKTVNKASIVLNTNSGFYSEVLVTISEV